MRVVFAMLAAAIVVLAPSLSYSDPPSTAVLSIRVTSLRSGNGQVGCTIYSSAKGFSASELQLRMGY